MSHRHIFTIAPDARAKLLAMFPRITPANLIRFDDLVAADRLLTDEGKPTQALVDWVKAVAR
jgi:hypothetical protein